MFQTPIFSEEEYTDILINNVMVATRRASTVFARQCFSSSLYGTEIYISLHDDIFEGFSASLFFSFHLLYDLIFFSFSWLQIFKDLIPVH